MKLSDCGAEALPWALVAVIWRVYEPGASFLVREMRPAKRTLLVPVRCALLQAIGSLSARACCPTRDLAVRCPVEPSSTRRASLTAERPSARRRGSADRPLARGRIRDCRLRRAGRADPRRRPERAVRPPDCPASRRTAVGAAQTGGTIMLSLPVAARRRRCTRSVADAGVAFARPRLQRRARLKQHAGGLRGHRRWQGRTSEVTCAADHAAVARACSASCGQQGIQGAQGSRRGRRAPRAKRILPDRSQAHCPSGVTHAWLAAANLQRDRRRRRSSASASRSAGSPPASMRTSASSSAARGSPGATVAGFAVRAATPAAAGDHQPTIGVRPADSGEVRTSEAPPAPGPRRRR